MKMKKAQSLSMNTVVIGALALLALIVIIFIFATRSRIVSTSLQNCETQKGTCFSSSQINAGLCSPVNSIQIPGTDCEERLGTGAKCCTRVIGGS